MDARTHKEEGRVKTDAKIAVMQPLAKKGQSASNHQKLGDKHGTDSSSEPPERTNLAKLLDFEPLASQIVKESISVVSSHPAGGPLLWQPQETNTLSNSEKYADESINSPRISSLRKYRHYCSATGLRTHTGKEE